MARPKLSEMTLREKVGQTGMPGPGEVRKGVQRHGGYGEYLKAYPFCGIYADQSMVDHNGEKFTSPRHVAETLANASNELKIPMFVSCDFEYGGKDMFSELHRISTNMSVGAAHSKELAFERGYLWAKEMKALGVNWPFGPVGDLNKSFFSSSIRKLGDSPEEVAELYPSMIQGIQAAGVAATAKHFPGAGRDFRDAHFCSTGNNTTVEDWIKNDRTIWKSAIDAGVLSFMTGHSPVPAFDPSFARGKIPRPGSASTKVIDLLRKDLEFDGVIVTDAVCMKALSAAFDNDDIYIECFNAGNDVILFVHDDYIDVMEKAILDGKISMERLDASVERILDLKEKIGLFDGEIEACDVLTEEESKHFDEVNYNIAKNALTLLANENEMIPFNPEKVKNVTIINISPNEKFLEDLEALKSAFERRGIRTNIMKYVKTKDELKNLSETEDIIIYACVPGRMNFYSSPEDLSTLFHSLAYGADKTVVVSFAAPSVYYNYFENADAYINAYSSDIGTMNALADGLLGEFEFTGKSPVVLEPQPIDNHK